MLPPVAPHSTEIDAPFDGPRIIAPAGVTQLYDVAPIDPVVEYDSTVFAHGDAFPEIAGGIAGAPYTASIREPLVPHALLAVTASVHKTKDDGQFTEMALRFDGPEIVPHTAVQL